MAVGRVLLSRGVSFGAGDGNRTRDLRITSASLYRLSYPGGWM